MVTKKSTKAREDFASNLRRLRASKGISQEKLAELAGMHRTYVSSVERAERNISIDNVYRLAEALQVSVKDLIGSSKK